MWLSYLLLVCNLLNISLAPWTNVYSALFLKGIVRLHHALLVVTWTGTHLSTGRCRHLRSSSDTYDIYYKNPALLPTIHTEPAEHPPGDVWTLEDGREATIEDVCQFIIEFINSDVMVRIYIQICFLSNALRYTAYRAYWPIGTWSSQINQRWVYIRLAEFL
jgi:hypothetical protein